MENFRHQAITWTITSLLSIWSLETYFSENMNEIVQQFHW